MEFKDIMADFADKLNFYAPESRQILADWINAVSIDWPISRRRYYATEVPLWYCKKCKFVIVPPKGNYYQPWREKPPVQKCPECNSTDIVGETRVFDTWFDSSISPLYILQYEKDPDFFKKHTPCTLRPQGKEIIRTWLYYTLLKDYLLTKKLIFRDAWIHYHVIDEKGHKMSKSKGNKLDPHDILDKFGAEPFRLWAVVEGNITSTDMRCSFERIEGAQKTITKLWNVARFISMFPSPEKPKLTAVDQWMLNEVNGLVRLAEEGYQKYDFHNPAIAIKHFIWETFASHYLELVKTRAYNQNATFTKAEQDSAQYTLHACLDKVLMLIAPIMPMVSFKIYHEMGKKDIHAESFPKTCKEHKALFSTKDIVEANSAIWKAKKDNGKSLRDAVKEITLPESLKSAAKDLAAMHHLEHISYGKELKIIL